MCKEMPVIPVNKVVDPTRIIGKKWRAEERRGTRGRRPPPKKKKLIYNSVGKQPIAEA
jgi:hypothetical protein